MKRVLTIFLLAVPLLFAEDARPVIAILPFEASDISSGEKETIEKLVQSYVSEIGDFRVVTPADREKALSEQEFTVLVKDPSQGGGGQDNALLAAQFLLSGSIGVLGEERVLTLESLKVKTGEKKSVSSIHRTMSELALGIRSLVMQVLEKGDPDTAKATGETAAAIVESDLIGTWKGDKGIELVRVFRDGKAIAVFSSGVRMDLFYRIQGNEVRFAQTSPNTPRFYHPVPYAVALELAKKAQPMQWTFSLSADGTALRGTKTATAVKYEGDVIVGMIQDAARDAEWTRASR